MRKTVLYFLVLFTALIVTSCKKDPLSPDGKSWVLDDGRYYGILDLRLGGGKCIYKFIIESEIESGKTYYFTKKDVYKYSLAKLGDGWIIKVGDCHFYLTNVTADKAFFDEYNLMYVVDYKSVVTPE